MLTVFYFKAKPVLYIVFVFCCRLQCDVSKDKLNCLVLFYIHKQCSHCAAFRKLMYRSGHIPRSNFTRLFNVYSFTPYTQQIVGGFFVRHSHMGDCPTYFKQGRACSVIQPRSSRAKAAVCFALRPHVGLTGAGGAA